MNATSLEKRVLFGAAALTAFVIACSSTTAGNGSDAGSASDAAASGSDAAAVADAAATIDAAKDGAGVSDSGTDAASDASADANDVSDAAVDAADAAPDVAPAPFVLQTNAFAQGASIPAVHACNTHASPALTWTAGPAGTMGYAVVMIDKTRVGTNDEVHWVLFDVPQGTLSLSQGVARSATPGTPAGSKQVNSFDGLPGYFGPCPPVGDAAHTYEFRVYAMSAANLANVTTATNKQTAAANVAAAALAVTNVVSGTYAR